MNSRTTKSFWRLYQALPEATRAQAVRAYRLWRANPNHPGLQFKCISEVHAAYSIRIGLHWRAIGYREPAEQGEDVITWFWIGSHAEYDRVIGGLP